MARKTDIKKALELLKKHEEKKQQRIKLIADKASAQIIKDNMTPAQKIAMLNTPYSQLPDELKPGMVHRPQKFNFIRMKHLNIGAQTETFSARLIRYCDKYSLTPQRLCEICNEYAAQFDLPATSTRPSQRIRITMRDLKEYMNYNVCPKIDKMMVIAGATDMPLDYFAGYGPNTRRRKKAA